MTLNTPFDYGSLLIGNEIISRGLNQQKTLSSKREYGMSWSQEDATLRKQAEDQGKITKKEDFTVPPKYQNCPVDPPCPWPKNSDDLEADMLMPVIMLNDGTTTYTLKVSTRIDSGTSSYKVGVTLADYSLNQSKLASSIQNSFLYYDHSSKITYTGKAILVIEKIQNGTVVAKFTYLFNLI